MLFGKSKRHPARMPASVSGTRSTADTSAADRSSGQPTRSTAETAHLVGPGCVKLRGGIVEWRPASGRRVLLHPKYLRRILIYGRADVSGAALQLLWREAIQIVYLSRGGHKLLGRLQPSGPSPHLPRLLHLAAADPGMRLRLAREVVLQKIVSEVNTTRYYQRQGKGKSAGAVLRKLLSLQGNVKEAESIPSLLGIEGAAGASWLQYFASLVPAPWEFQHRRSRPPDGPVNALLSLGYTFALSRCQTQLAAADLDPLVGFLHEVRSGRPALACDLVEPLRAPLVDRLVLTVLGRRQLTEESFDGGRTGSRLTSKGFRRYLGIFEETFNDVSNGPSWKQQTDERIETLSHAIRNHLSDKNCSNRE